MRRSRLHPVHIPLSFSLFLDFQKLSTVPIQVPQKHRLASLPTMYLNPLLQLSILTAIRGSYVLFMFPYTNALAQTRVNRYFRKKKTRILATSHARVRFLPDIITSRIHLVIVCGQTQRTFPTWHIRLFPLLLSSRIYFSRYFVPVRRYRRCHRYVNYCDVLPTRQTPRNFMIQECL